MNSIKRKLSVLMTLALTGAALSACGGNTGGGTATGGTTTSADSANSAAAPTETAGAVAAGDNRIVCTGFAQYDFVNQILGENPAGIEVVYLLGSGVDMHNYQASAEDMIKIKTSDLFLYTGGESEQWVDTLVSQTSGNSFQAMALLDMVDAKEELIVQGMEHGHEHEDEEHAHEDEEHAHEDEEHAHEDEEHASEDEEHAHEDEEHAHESEELAEDGDGSHVHEGVYDEHVWLSLKNSIRIVDTIGEAICEIDPANAETYRANAAAYTAQLSDLDGRYEEAVSGAARNAILVADRFPFRYLADDYHLSYYAAFPGCAAETEASFETVIFLAEKIGELKLPSVFIIDGSDGKIAQTVIANSQETEAEIKTLNSIQSVSTDDINSGVTYLGLMEENLTQLKEALN